MKKIKKRYIFIVILIILLCNALLFGMVIGYSGDSYTILPVPEKGDLYPMVTIRRELLDFRIPFVLWTFIGFSDRENITISFSFKNSGTSFHTSRSKYYDIKDKLDTIKCVAINNAYITQMKKRHKYDLLEKYAKNERTFSQPLHIPLSFKLAEGDNLYMDGTIFFVDGTSVDFMTNYIVEKESDYYWEMGFYLTGAG